MNNNVSMFVKGRAFKRGSLSIALTAVVIAVVFVLNIVVTALTEKNYWYIDMTGTKVFSVSDEGLNALKDVKSEVNIIFCNSLDKIEGDYYMNMIYSTAKELSAHYDNINIKWLDIYKNPKAVEMYKKTPMDQITQTSVIIESGSESRVYPQTSFFVRDEASYEPLGYDGEYRLISAILYVTADDHPKAYFTVGHGESLTTETQELWYLFEAAGYEVNNINLMEDDIPEDTRFIVIHNPLKDFEGLSENTQRKDISEIEKIDDFLDGFGCLMVFMRPETPEFPILDSYLKEWGISFNRHTIKDIDSSITLDGDSISAQYATGNSYGADLVKSITELAVTPKTIVEHATSINIEYESYMRRVPSAVLTTTKTAGVVNDEGFVSDKGVYNLMTLTCENRVIDNIDYSSYVLAVGSTEFASNEYLGQGAYSNRDILFSAMNLLGREKVPFDIDFEYFDNTELDITAKEATSWAMALIITLPAIAVLCCTVVLVRRKHA